MHILHPILYEMRNSPRRWNELLWNKYFQLIPMDFPRPRAPLALPRPNFPFPI